MDRAPHPAKEAVTTVFLREEIQDRRTLRLATVLAVLLHAVLFAVTVPELAQDVAEARSPKVFVVRPVRPRPPVDPRQTMPRERARRVPIPDPTPEDPEPLLLAAPEFPTFELPSDLLRFDSVVPPPPPEEQGPVEFHSKMVRPVRISGIDPHYTEIARRARLEGVVILRAIIDREGNVTDVSIVKPLGLGLDDSAVAAVQDWRFEPATLNGEPVDVIYRVTVRFSLR